MKNSFLLFITLFYLNGSIQAQLINEYSFFEFGSQKYFDKHGSIGFTCHGQNELLAIDIDDSSAFYFVSDYDFELIYTGKAKILNNQLIISFTGKFSERFDFEDEQPYYIDSFKIAWVDTFVKANLPDADLFSTTDKSTLMGPCGEEKISSIMKELMMRSILLERINFPIQQMFDFNIQTDSIIIDSFKVLLNDDEGNAERPFGGYRSATIFYAPDSTFKVFNFEGEACGAHCSTVGYNIICLKNGTIKFVDEVGYIDTIIKLDPDLYLISDSRGFGGTMGGASYDLQIITIKNAEIQNSKFLMDTTKIPLSFKLYKTPFSSETIHFFDPLGGCSKGFKTEQGSDYLLVSYQYAIFNTEIEDFLRSKKIKIKGTKTADSNIKISTSFKLRKNLIFDFKETYCYYLDEE